MKKERPSFKITGNGHICVDSKKLIKLKTVKKYLKRRMSK